MNLFLIFRIPVGQGHTELQRLIFEGHMSRVGITTTVSEKMENSRFMNFIEVPLSRVLQTLSVYN